MDFHHFIITRFNVNIHPREFEFRLSETWLAERFELFSRFCFPSILHQEEQSFTWYILFDENTPERFRRMIQTFEKYTNLKIIFCGHYHSILPKIIQTMKCAYPEVDFFLTTRFDNDDALSCKFVAELHKVVRSILSKSDGIPLEMFINFTNGLQYCDGHVYEFKDATNAFVSLLEKSDSPHTVFWVDHPSIYDKAPVAQIVGKPIFLQNIHKCNVYNYVRGELIQESKIVDDFHLNL